MPKQKSISQTNTLRISDTELIDRLNRAYGGAGPKQKSKNDYLLELVQAGLDQKQYDEALLQKLFDGDRDAAARLDKIDERLISMEKNMLKSFNVQYWYNNIIRAILSNLYAFAEAANDNTALVKQDVDAGYYDVLPDRFQDLSDEYKGRYGL